MSDAAGDDDGRSKMEVQAIETNEIPEDTENVEEPPTKTSKPIYQDWESQKEPSEISLVEGNRDKWTNPIEFLMTCLSTAVGLGNVWRFPFTAYDNGGGAFLIPFLIVLLILGTPLYFLEMSVGQFCSRGPIGIWDMAPIGRGIGWAFLFIAACTVLYYVSILATCILYFIYGFAAQLPWAKCYYNANTRTSEWYSTENRKIFKTLKCNDSFGEYTDQFGMTARISNAELFFKYAVSRQADNIDGGLGAPGWQMTTALYFVWVIIFLNVMLGTKTSGKFAYFTALFPYVVLITLFIKAVTLEGSTAGIAYFFKADWKKIGEIEVWFKAVSQCFFSLGVGYGVITTYGSYNPVRRKIYWDVLFICVMDTMTSILAGVTVFAILGVLARIKGEDISKVTSGGNGLAFVSYPEIVLKFDGAAQQIFSALFFLMLLTLGIGSGSSYITAICGTLFDRVQFISNRKCYRIIATAVVCFSFCTVGLIFATPGGNYMIDFFDTYSSGFVVYAIVIFQISGIVYVYGMKNFARDLQFMFGGKGFKVCYVIFQIWGYAAPFGLIIVLGYVLHDAAGKPLKTLDGDFPPLATACGWILFLIIVLTVPVFAVAVFVTRKSRSAKKRLWASVKPNLKWGPKPVADREEWEDYKRGYDGDTLLWKLTFGKSCKDPARPAEPEEAPIPVSRPESTPNTANTLENPNNLEAGEE